MDVILTGFPRSGTTLCCHLLNKLPACIALHEPMTPSHHGAQSEDAFLETITEFFHEQRASLLEKGTALSKATPDGRVPDNPFESVIGPAGSRCAITQLSRIKPSQPLPPSFLLVIKHPGMFTVKLPVLKNRFPCFATIRNPLALLLAWASVPLPIADGRLPVAEKFDATLAAALASEQEIVGRQIRILSHFSDIYHDHLARERVFRYEDLVASGGRLLATIDPEALRLNERLASKNTNPLYVRENVEMLAEQLLETPGGWRHFYNEAEIIHLRNLWRTC